MCITITRWRTHSTYRYKTNKTKLNKTKQNREKERMNCQVKLKNVFLYSNIVIECFDGKLFKVSV